MKEWRRHDVLPRNLDDAQALAQRIHDTTGCDTRVGSYLGGIGAYEVLVWTGPPGTAPNGGDPYDLSKDRSE